MKLGYDGEAWARDLIDYADQCPDRVTDWQKKFLSDYSEKVDEYEMLTYISQGQLTQINKIAESLGVEGMTEDDFDT